MLLKLGNSSISKSSRADTVTDKYNISHVLHVVWIRAVFVPEKMKSMNIVSKCVLCVYSVYAV